MLELMGGKEVYIEGGGVSLTVRRVTFPLYLVACYFLRPKLLTIFRCSETRWSHFLLYVAVL